jgi:hypothetical protein
MSTKESVRRPQFSAALAVGLCFLLASYAAAGQGPSAKLSAAENLAKLPLTFEANRGQSSSRAQYISRGSGYTLFLTADEAVLKLTASAGQKGGNHFSIATSKSEGTGD